MIVLMFTVVLFRPTPFHLKYAFYIDCYNKSHNTSHLLWCICSIIFMVYMFHNFYGCSYIYEGSKFDIGITYPWTHGARKRD